MSYKKEHSDYLRKLSNELSIAGRKVERTEKAFEEAQEAYDTILDKFQTASAEIKAGTFVLPSEEAPEEDSFDDEESA